MTVSQEEDEDLESEQENGITWFSREDSVDECFKD